MAEYLREVRFVANQNDAAGALKGPQNGPKIYEAFCRKVALIVLAGPLSPSAREL